MPENTSFVSREKRHREGKDTKQSEKAPLGTRGPGGSHQPGPRKREMGRFPQQRSVRGRRGARVTILACQSNFILSFLSGTRTLHGAPCSEAVGTSLWPGSGSPRFPRALLPHRRRRARPGHKRAPASEQAAREPAAADSSPPLRDVRLSCLCLRERTLPFGSPADQGSKQSFLQLRSGGERMLSSRPLRRGFLVATRCQNGTMCALGRVCAASVRFTEGNWGDSG